MTIGNDHGYEQDPRSSRVVEQSTESHHLAHVTRDLMPLLAEHRLSEAGSNVALERLLARLEPVVRRFLQRRVAASGWDAEFVQESTQQSLVAIVFSLHGCRATTDAELVGWALGVARIQLADLLRREGPRGDSFDDPHPPVVGESLDASVGRCDDVDPGLEILLGVVGRVSDALPDDTAALLWMRLVCDYEWREVGEALGISAGAAKLRFQRLVVTMRKLVHKQLAVLPAPERASGLAWLARRLSDVGNG